MTGGAMAMAAAARSDAPPVEGQLPSLDGAVGWLNSGPLTSESLRGKVVVIDFWTYSCINCLRTLPYVRAWHDRYADKGLVIIGVHTPEFAFEKEKSNVQRAVRELRIRYPVAIDNDYAIWRAFNNEYWPAHYFIDAQGRVRGHHFGEGAYDESEKLIRKLLAEAGHAELPAAASASMPGQGVEVAADENNIASPETYVGYERAENFSSPGGFETNRVKAYSTPSALRLNQWGLGGRWTVAGESAVAQAAATTLTFRFHARDLHLVLGPSADGKPVRFRVSIDGREPAGHHGADIDEHGLGVVREQRLYQLIRQSDGVSDRTFTIEFLDPGAHAYAFTFG
jgi:thiol-disulfide isomerase/thioredoxin